MNIIKLILILGIVHFVPTLSFANTPSDLLNSYPESIQNKYGLDSCEEKTYYVLRQNRGYRFYLEHKNNSETRKSYINSRAIFFFDSNGEYFKTDPGDRTIIDPGDAYDWTNELRSSNYQIHPRESKRILQTGDTNWRVVSPITLSNQDYSFAIQYITIYDRSNTPSDKSDDKATSVCVFYTVEENQTATSITEQAKTPIEEFNNSVESVFWFESSPPEKGDTDFFEGVKGALAGLENNNLILKQRSKDKGVTPFSLDEATATYSQYEKDLNISSDYFYDLETAQIIAAIQMYTNLCRLTDGCTRNQLEAFIKGKLINGAYEFTRKNRDVARKRDVDTRNTEIMLAIGGALVVDMVSSIINNRGSNRNYSNNSDNYCNVNQECYSVIQTSNDSTRIRCKNRGLEYDIYYDDTNGKYFTSGFMVRHYEESFKKLANYSCGVF